MIASVDGSGILGALVGKDVGRHMQTIQRVTLPVHGPQSMDGVAKSTSGIGDIMTWILIPPIFSTLRIRPKPSEGICRAFNLAWNRALDFSTSYRMSITVIYLL